MVIRLFVYLCLITLFVGFIFFAANVIWLGTKAFFAKYGSSKKKIVKCTNKKARNKKDSKNEIYDPLKDPENF